MALLGLWPIAAVLVVALLSELIFGGPPARGDRSELF